MKGKLLAALAVLALFGSVYEVGHQERQSQCVLQREGRVQGNVRANHLKLVEAAIISSNEKAQKEIPSYHYPKAITELQEGAPIEVLPPIVC